MTVHLPLLMLSLHAAAGAPECAGCSQEQKELIADISYLMDEFILDPEDLEEVFEAEDLEPPSIAPTDRWHWVEALLPDLGLKIYMPLAGPVGRHVTWEVFFFFNLRR